MAKKQNKRKVAFNKLATAKVNEQASVAVQPPLQIAPTVISPTPAPPVLPPPQKDNVLFFIQNTKEGIEPADVARVETTITQATTNNKLFIVLHTVGGDVYSAVSIMKILQKRFTEIHVLIPEYAYSSGTVMSCAANKIYMSVKASLGPLDKPMEHFKDGSDMSSLDITKTLTNITSICASMGKSIYAQLRRDELRLGKEAASKIAFDTASKLVIPIISQIDPFNLQRGFREAEIGRDYAYDMLCTRMMAGNRYQAIKTSNSLVNDYPSHGFCLFREECKDILKLSVFDLEDLPEWARFKQRYDILKEEYSRYIKIEQL